MNRLHDLMTNERYIASWGALGGVKLYGFINLPESIKIECVSHWGHLCPVYHCVKLHSNAKGVYAVVCGRRLYLSDAVAGVGTV